MKKVKLTFSFVTSVPTTINYRSRYQSLFIESLLKSKGTQDALAFDVADKRQSTYLISHSPNVNFKFCCCSSLVGYFFWKKKNNK